MKNVFRLLALVTATGLASCGGIGQGSTVQTIRVVFSPTSWDQGAIVKDSDAALRHLEMYDCFCANLALESTFTDGTVTYSQTYRAKWTSSDPATLAVMNYGDATNSACPLAQGGAGMVQPLKPGTATITAEFLGKKATLDVIVGDTSEKLKDSGGTSTLKLAPSDTTNTQAHVAVTAIMPMRISGTLDNRPRTFNLNVMSWAFSPANDAVATVNAIGTVTGIGRDNGTPQNLQATFSCSDVVATASVRVGDILPPLLLSSETDFNGDGLGNDGLMALSSNELLNIVAPLDFDNDGTADGQQPVNSQAGLSFTDACTLRQHDPADTTGVTCLETTSTCDSRAEPATCATTTAGNCAIGMTACRVTGAPVNAFGTNTVLAMADTGTAANFLATYPLVHGTATTLSAAVDASATTLTVAALTGYPAVPWYGVIDDANAGTREVVKVTAVSGTTLTVERGIDSTPQAHASGVTFVQRTYSSDDASRLPLTVKAGTLTTVVLETPPSSLEALGTLQLQADGNYHNDTDNTDRQQRVTRISTLVSGAPAMAWMTSDFTVANVSSSGLVTSTNSCGGTVVIRARASTSTNTDDAAFAAPDAAAAGADDVDGNGNTDANDAACLGTDPLCDQITLTVPARNPLPPGIDSCS